MEVLERSISLGDPPPRPKRYQAARDWTSPRGPTAGGRRRAGTWACGWVDGTGRRGRRINPPEAPSSCAVECPSGAWLLGMWGTTRGGSPRIKDPPCRTPSSVCSLLLLLHHVEAAAVSFFFSDCYCLVGESEGPRRGLWESGGSFRMVTGTAASNRHGSGVPRRKAEPGGRQQQQRSQGPKAPPVQGH